MPFAKTTRLSSELDPTTFPSFRDRVLAAEGAPPEHTTRSYPGYPRFALPRTRDRRLTSFDAVVKARRSARSLGERLPSAKEMSLLLRLGHGITGEGGRGPAPAAGNLQGIELYVATLTGGWLPRGTYHYDRADHCLAQLRPSGGREEWAALIPSMSQFEGGALLFILCGDAARVEKKYGDRGLRFLLLEAGHVMQSVCLAAASVGLSVLPVGGFYERALERELRLPRTDLALYVGACGEPR